MSDPAYAAANRISVRFAELMCDYTTRADELTDEGIDEVAELIREKYVARLNWLEDQLLFWVGGYGGDDPKIAEWRTLLQKEDRTDDDTRRMATLAEQIRVAAEDEPELRIRIATLEARNVALEAVASAGKWWRARRGDFANQPIYARQAAMTHAENLLVAALDAAKETT